MEILAEKRVRLYQVKIKEMNESEPFQVSIITYAMSKSRG